MADVSFFVFVTVSSLLSVFFVSTLLYVFKVDEIESKLAVICVRNKVNFTEEKQEETKPVATFTCEEVDTTPAWLKAVQRTQAKNR